MSLLQTFIDEEMIGSDTLVADGFDDAVIGITNNHILVYSIEKMINILMKTSDYTGADSEMDAIDYLSYNVFDNYVGEKTPIYTYTKESFYDTSK
tara:strand:+ start:29 stop:313 length:285 start_codon:yes stop_codon:yes gene_type:complete